MSLSWNDPREPDQVCKNQQPWVSRGPRQDPQLFLMLPCQGPPNLSLTFTCGLLVWQTKKQQLHSSVRLHGQKTHERNGSAQAVFTKTSALRSTRKRQGSKDKTASPVSTWPCQCPSTFTNDNSSHAKSTTHLKLGVLLGLCLRKWQPPLWVNGTLPKGLGRAKMPLPICWFPSSLRLYPRASFT